MTMNTSVKYCLLSTVAVFIILVHLLSPSPSPSPSINQHFSPIPNRGMQMEEEKTRLGSTPPSCWNKCNRCHPCMAVQVPTMPNHNKRKKKKKSKSITFPMEFLDPPSNGYTNYKPLGWKCRCRNHLFNP